MNPQISIIVPVYNAERYLSRCIDSILNQTFSDFELLLIDDGSLDNSGNICDEYAKKDTRIRVFHKKNGGVSSARNLGLDNVVGEWIYFVDADDALFKDCLEILFFRISENVDCVNGSHIIIEGNSIVSRIITNSEMFLDYKKALLYLYNPINGQFNAYLWNRIFRHSVIKKNGLRFHEDIFYKEDGLFIVEFLCKSKKQVYVTNKSVYKYFINEGSAMSNLNTTFNVKYLTNLDARIRCYQNIKAVTTIFDFRLRYEALYSVMQMYSIINERIILYNITDRTIEYENSKKIEGLIPNYNFYFFLKRIKGFLKRIKNEK